MFVSLCSGACVCEEDYTGDDCSFYKNHIPDVYDFSNEGLCDKSSRPCEAMPVYADLFIESDQLKCAVQVLDVCIVNHLTGLRLSHRS